MRLVKALFWIVVLLCIGYGSMRVYRHFNRPKPQPIPPREEITITIIPGWNLRQVAEMLVLKGLASSTQDVYAITGEPGKVAGKADFYGPSDDLIEQKPGGISMEGYLAPETVRVFADDPLADGVIDKFYFIRAEQITDAMRVEAERQGRSMHEVLTMASIVEDEAKTAADRKMVADILWRRNARHWALQVDSSVHYVIDKTGTVFTTGKERDVDSPWNTYKYPGLPPGPICNPSLESIDAALHPTPNSYWYFLSGRDGTMHYAKTLDEHAANKKYL